MSNIVDAFYTDIAHTQGDFVKTSNGDLGTVSGLANYKLALFHRLITTPGDYVHRPTYGVGILRYQNGLSSFAKQQELATKIKEQFLLDPRTQSVSSVSIANSDENPQLTVVRVSVKPIGYSELALAFIPFAGDIA